MSHVVVLAGGSPHAHDFPAIGTALAQMASELGHAVQSVADPDQAVALLTDTQRAINPIGALVIDGLWWRMLGDAYEPWREQYGYSPSAATRETLSSFVSSGGGLLALHTTPICFDDWPEWGDVVGGSWQWGVSSHPMVGTVTAQIVGHHPVVAGLPSVITLHDEVYGDMQVRDDVEVLAVAKRHADDVDQPVVWTHTYGSGRVVFDGFGHDAVSIRQPHHAQLIEQALTWVLEAK